MSTCSPTLSQPSTSEYRNGGRIAALIAVERRSAAVQRRRPCARQGAFNHAPTILSSGGGVRPRKFGMA